MTKIKAKCQIHKRRLFLSDGGKKLCLAPSGDHIIERVTPNKAATSSGPKWRRKLKKEAIK